VDFAFLEARTCLGSPLDGVDDRPEEGTGSLLVPRCVDFAFVEARTCLGFPLDGVDEGPEEGTGSLLAPGVDFAFVEATTCFGSTGLPDFIETTLDELVSLSCTPTTIWNRHILRQQQVIVEWKERKA
jgi:hypothetical protein